MGKNGVFLLHKMKSMEDNDMLFWEGLLNILKEPWKSPPVIQDTIPPLALTIDSNPDADKQDIFNFYYIRLGFPFYFVSACFVQNNKHFFSYFTDGDGLFLFSPVYKASRLTTHDIFEVFSWLSRDCALVLLEHIDCPLSVYTELIDSLEANEKERFIEVIDNLDLANIIPTLSFVRFLINAISFIQDRAVSKDNNVGEDDMDCEVKNSRILYNLDKTLMNKFGHPAKGYLKQVILSMTERCLNMEVLPVAFFSFLYSSLYCVYCWMDEDGFLTEWDKKVFEYIFHQPAFEEQYNQNLDWWKNEILEEKVTEFIKECGGFEVIDSIPPPKIRIKKKWRLRNYLSRNVEIEGNHCEGIKDSIIQCGDYALTKFICKIADLGYIDDDPTTKNSFAYVLTGRGGFKTEIIDVIWHHTETEAKEGKVPQSVLVLLYISKHMFENTTGETYTQLFKLLHAGPNPYIKDGRDQSPSYADSVNEPFKAFFQKCFGKKQKQSNQ